MAAFALFETQPMALAAQDRLLGITFDPEKTPYLKLDCRLAQKNLILSRSEAIQIQNSHRHFSQQMQFPNFPADVRDLRSSSHHQSQRSHSSRGYESGHRSSYSSMSSSMSPPYPSSYSLPLLPTPPHPDPNIMNIRPPLQSRSNHKTTRSYSKGSQAGTPGTTLFLSNLHAVSNSELLIICRFCEGFRDFKLISDKRKRPVAFVAYRTADQATRAMQYIHSLPQGIRAEFSKNPLGKYTNVPKKKQKKYHNNNMKEYPMAPIAVLEGEIEPEPVLETIIENEEDEVVVEEEQVLML